MLRRSDNSLITTIFSGTTGHSVSYNILTSYQLVISFAGNAFTQFVRLGFVKGFYLSSLNASDETLYGTPVFKNCTFQYVERSSLVVGFILVVSYFSTK